MTHRKLTPQELEHLRQIIVEEEIPYVGAASYDQAMWGTPAEQELLNLFTTELTYETGEVFVEESEPGDVMYLIRSGRVAVFKGDVQSPTVLGVRGPGELVGEMTLVDDYPRSASLVALEPVVVLRLSNDDFHKLMHRAPALSTKLIETLSLRLRENSLISHHSEQAKRQFAQRMSQLETENQYLLELQRVRQETSDLIVHDLRNPLGLIKFALESLEMMLPGEVLQENRRTLDIAQTACDKMQYLVDTLLDVSRLEEGVVQLDRSQFALADLVTDMAQRFSSLLERRSITLHTHVPTDLFLYGDRVRLDRVLTNLLDNAIKFTPEGGEIVIEAEKKGDQVYISVIDSGPGIPPKERQRIFERFAQVKSDSPNVRSRGFGLGLVFCRMAVEAHGGRIWVESGPGGKGSRFTFTLPLGSA